MAELKQPGYLKARRGKWWLIRAIAAVVLCAAFQVSATAQTPRFDNAMNWRSEPVVWGKVIGISDSASVLAPITAHYNMAYGATVLGLNAREGSTVYYAVVANYHDGLLDVLDTIGPLEAPVEWQSGPYHLAAGLPDGRLVVFLTAPGEYPYRITLDWQYAPRTPFYCVVRQPEPVNEHWETWSITAAYQVNLPQAELETKTFNGLGRTLDSAPAIDLLNTLRSVVYLDRPIPNASIPMLGCVTSRGVFAAWHEYGRGWHIEKLAGEQLGNCRLGFVPHATDPALLALYYDESDAFSALQLQRINLNYSDEGVAIRWGRSGSLSEDYDIRSHVFINSALSPQPLLAYATDADVYLAWMDPQADSRLRDLTLRSERLRYGERLTGTSGDPAAYPILGVAGAAHWHTGYPEIFWVQLGSSFGGGGQLFRLVFEPRQN